MRRRLVAALLVTVLALAAIVPVSAGGFALARLVSPVEGIVVGKPVAVELQVLAHGIEGHVVTTSAPLTITARHRATGVEVDAVALPDAVSQTFRASITFPQTGEWSWSATDGGYVQPSPLPMLKVLGNGKDAEQATPAELDASVRVTIRDGGFELPDEPIHVGDTIAWVNEGTLSHVVMSADRGFENVPLLQPGETYRTTATEAGTFAIFCPPHAGMVASVVVEP
ncbi:MAG: cupredoxin domain-containing protein [Thermomicrobiales bacterium]